MLCCVGLVGAVGLCVVALESAAQDSHPLMRVLLLQDHNTRIVVFGTTLLGATAGCIGTFLVLRRRALLGDAVSHATLPGIGLAFMAMVMFGGTGKWLPGLLLGALLSGLLGMGAVLLIRRYSRIREDAALGIVLSVFFGAGVAILGIVQRMSQGHAAGLESFILGKTASMITEDLYMIMLVGVVVVIACSLLMKELSLLCFDEHFASTQGWPIARLDVFMISMVVVVTVIGLQAVGLILIIAMLIIPAAGARFWTERMHVMLLTSVLIGGLSGGIGSVISALAPKLPAGAIIVLVASGFFFVSMMFGQSRGMAQRWYRQVRLQRRVSRQHLLRAMFEYNEQQREDGGQTGETKPKALPVPHAYLLEERSWTGQELQRELRRAEDDGHIRAGTNNDWHLTQSGMNEASHLVKNHRLWELYLITHADIAPSHVDRDADTIEHILSPEMILRLEALLDKQQTVPQIPDSPHEINPAAGPSAEGGGA